MVFRLIVIWSVLGLALSCDAKACSLKTDIVSLSGPITMLMEELNLLEDKKLAAISHFHPIQKKTNARALKGGLFLSLRELKKYNHHLFFVDKSVEFERMLERSKISNVVTLNTRGIGSIEATELSLNKLAPFLSGCDKRVNTLRARLAELIATLKEQKPKKMIFYLGSKKNKKPEYIMARDGFVLDLMTYSKLQSFESSLHYVLWSQKELKKYSNYIEIGIVHNAKETKLKISMYSPRNCDVSYPGVLIPGISQVNFLKAFVRSELFKD